MDDDTAGTLLDLVRIAAHVSGERTNAPLLSYLVGLAVARGADLDEYRRGRYLVLRGG